MGTIPQPQLGYGNSHSWTVVSCSFTFLPPFRLPAASTFLMVRSFLRLTSLPIDPGFLSSKTARCVEAIFCAPSVHFHRKCTSIEFTSSATAELKIFCVLEPCEPPRSTILTTVLISIPSRCQSEGWKNLEDLPRSRFTGVRDGFKVYNARDPE